MEILIKEIAVNPVTKNEDSAPGVSTLVWLQHNQNLLLIVREFVRGNTSPPHLISSIYIRMNMVYILSTSKGGTTSRHKSSCLPGLWKRFHFHFHLLAFNGIIHRGDIVQVNGVQSGYPPTPSYLSKDFQ